MSFKQIQENLLDNCLTEDVSSENWVNWVLVKTLTWLVVLVYMYIYAFCNQNFPGAFPVSFLDMPSGLWSWMQTLLEWIHIGLLDSAFWSVVSSNQLGEGTLAGTGVRRCSFPAEPMHLFFGGVYLSGAGCVPGSRQVEGGAGHEDPALGACLQLLRLQITESLKAEAMWYRWWHSTCTSLRHGLMLRMQRSSITVFPVNTIRGACFLSRPTVQSIWRLSRTVALNLMIPAIYSLLPFLLPNNLLRWICCIKESTIIICSGRHTWILHYFNFPIPKLTNCKLKIWRKKEKYLDIEIGEEQSSGHRADRKSVV